ncbi:MAG: type IV toxin-antitoxin system AbiEi family antitoxin domain-containing protein [Mollicutes bacterium]|nr:type IV toxin-antitoxin system AbiEi family antitoxin domain-containing protein [Mollicutes bacterium]
MKENTNYSKLKQIFDNNGGYITTEDVRNANISSWFLSDFVKRKDLNKIAPGFYADNSYFPDDYYIIQKRYPKYIFSGMSALYLHHLTDKIPVNIEVCAPQGYNPTRNKIKTLSIRKISNPDVYNLGITELKTTFGNKVKVYDEERTICDLIKYRDRYDGETFIKGIKLYANKSNNQIKLFRYARILGIEKKVFEIMELVNNND